MTEDDQLNRLCDYAGLETSYWDVAGGYHQVPRAAKISLLAALGYGAASDDEAAATLNRLREEDRQRLLPPVIVLREGGSYAVSLAAPAADLAGGVSWFVQLELGGERNGTARDDDLAAQEAYQSAGRDYHRVSFTLKQDLPQGYHRLTVKSGGAGHETTAETRLIIAPRRAYLPQVVGEDGVWGLAHQLYSLRGSSDWGIGQFPDLGDVCDQIAKAGGDVAGVNPLHALFASNPQSASPYSPSSRLFLNPVYIDVEVLPEYGQLDETLRDELVLLRRHAADGDQVDYEAVWPLKMNALRLVFAAFEINADSDRQAALQAFTDQGGEALSNFALYQALEAHFETAALAWPLGYDHPASGKAAAFAEKHADEIRFHIFVQWIADQQLSRVSDDCTAQGMRIGLYGDLAVGADPAGAELWSCPQHYVQNVTFGAPPDPLAQQGQNWGLPPFNPLSLRAAGYQPFIDILRASMRYCGALRVDHVMWMQRMFWIPAGAETSEGAYMRFPLDDLLAITALESQRNRCCVIGEDLGTVPAGFRETMQDYGLLCYRLMRFERYDNGLFKRPDTYPPLSLAIFGSHDLPPLAGFWRGRDLEVLDGIGLLAGAEGLAEGRALRAADRQQLVAALADQGVLSQSDRQAAGDELDISALIDAVHTFLARTQSALVMLNLEDVLHSAGQINVPGTYLEHANWRLRHGKVNIAGKLAQLGRIMGKRSRC